MKDPGSYANPINSSFQKFRTTRACLHSESTLLKHTPSGCPSKADVNVQLQGLMCQSYWGIEVCW